MIARISMETFAKMYRCLMFWRHPETLPAEVVALAAEEINDLKVWQLSELTTADVMTFEQFQELNAGRFQLYEAGSAE